MIVYRTRFNQEMHPGRKEFYYGVHNGSSDSYLGSGKILKDYIKKYGAESFVRDFIYEGDDAYKVEALIVDKQMLSNPFCLNYKLGGEGGWSHIKDWSVVSRTHKGVPKSEDQKKKMSESHKGMKKPWASKSNIERGRSCIFDGVEYESVTAAHRATGVNRKRITKYAEFI